MLSHEEPPAAPLSALVLPGFAARFLDRQACLGWLLETLNPGGPACPGCRAALPQGRHARWRSGARLQCQACGRWFHGLSGTLLEGCKLDPAQVVTLAMCLGLGLADKQAASLVGASAETVRQWRLRLAAAGR